MVEAQEDLFGGASPADVGIDDQVEEIERDVYPRLIEKGKLTAEDAGRQMLCLEAALGTLRSVRGNRRDLAKLRDARCDPSGPHL